MNNELVLYLGRRALETAMLLSAPVLGVIVVVGFAIGIFQAVTSIRDMTLGMAVKLGCLGVTLLICGGWMMQIAVGFTNEVFNHLQSMGP